MGSIKATTLSSGSTAKQSSSTLHKADRWSCRSDEYNVASVKTTSSTIKPFLLLTFDGSTAMAQCRKWQKLYNKNFKIRADDGNILSTVKYHAIECCW